MMNNTLELYENKKVEDEEFPAEIQNRKFGIRGFQFTRHWHEHMELHYVLEGIGYFGVGQQEYVAESGTLIIVNSNELHWGCGGTETVEDHVLIFCMDAFSKEFDEQNLVFCNAIHNDPQIHAYMEGIWKEIQQKDPGYKASCKAQLTQLLVYLRRNYVVQTLTKEESSRKKQELERLNRVIAYIEKHYTEPISNQTLADSVYLSKGRFEHLFRQNIGVPPLQYINELRLKKAMSMLKGSDSSLTEIATAAGFGNYNHFGRLFLRYYGCTPRQAQLRVKKAESYE